MAKKNKIFSGRPYNPRGSVKRFNKNVLPKIMAHDSLEDLTLEERRDFKAFIRSQQKAIRAELQTPLAQQTLTGKMAIKEHLADRKLTDDPVKLYSEWMRLNQFRESIQVDYDAIKLAEEDDKFKDVVKDQDKWLILRRLALYDQRLNIDRAYASMVLHAIEDIIVQANAKDTTYSGMSYGDIADMLLDQFLTNGHYDFMAEWDDDLQEFSDDDDDRLFANRGFHGRKRAEEDRERYRRWHNHQFSSYDPLYKDPEKVNEMFEEWIRDMQFKEVYDSPTQGRFR